MNASTDRTEFPAPSVIAVNGVELEVFEAGRQHAGATVVLCHGWPDLAFTWRHQVPALVEAGYRVIAPNQRGYGGSSRPAEVTAYDVAHLTGDLVALLDHYGCEDATFIGHDWGAMVVWSLALLHPARVDKVVCLSLPYPERGTTTWIEAMESALGADHYFVHFNRRPGVADDVLDANTARFLRNLYRRNGRSEEPRPVMSMIELAREQTPDGEPLMSPADLAVYVDAFARSGFTAGINWYRNLDRDWHLLADVDPIVRRPALMIYGDRDTVAPAEDLAAFVPGVEEVRLDSGHWIQQEQPEATNRVILDWLKRHERITA